jgi:hypothetical protein
VASQRRLPRNLLQDAAGEGHRELNEETKKFLEELTEEDVKRIKKAIKTYVFVEALGWFLRWTFLTFLAIAVSITQFGDSIKKIFDWFK